VRVVGIMVYFWGELLLLIVFKFPTNNNNNNNTMRSISKATEPNACNARETQSKVSKYEGGSTGGGGGGACRVWEIIN